MLCTSEINGNLKITRTLCLILFSFFIFAQLSSALHIPDQDSSETEAVPASTATNNSTEDDLYVIKAVVYEIGILTDADNSTNATTERQDVKLSFYKPPSKDDSEP
ncbi:uncharacterized protein LOC113463816 [Ceratina calcarata]|uniref:Uncharacterized protein LOC113463816 n=1 Tax=Ceratina calcarata TaxID=156304 RepID=A0AAJ7WC08_9HYME|nr:uncharacterized protein LOC113463816 [Ceratina calcarata]